MVSNKIVSVMAVLALQGFDAAAATDSGSEIRTGRYMAYTPAPSLDVMDFLSKSVSVKFGKNIHSLGDATVALLAGTGYSLVKPESQPKHLAQLLSKPVPHSMRTFEVLPRRSIFDALIGEGFFIVTDDVNKLLSFEPYKAYLDSYRLSPEAFSTAGVAQEEQPVGAIVIQSSEPDIELTPATDPADDSVGDISRDAGIPVAEPVLPVSRVVAGTFRENVERLAHELGFGLVIWDRRVEKCIWNQRTEYSITDVLPGASPIEILSYYAMTQDFKIAHSSVDNHVSLHYVGPIERLGGCQ